MLIDKSKLQQVQESYNLDDLTELRDREMHEAEAAREEAEKKATLEKLRGAFLDVTEGLYEELFSKEVEPEHVTILQSYPMAKENYKEVLVEIVKTRRTGFTRQNDARIVSSVAVTTCVAKISVQFRRNWASRPRNSDSTPPKPL